MDNLFLSSLDYDFWWYCILFLWVCFLVLKVIPEIERQKVIIEIENNNPDYYFDRNLKIQKVWAVGE